MTISACRVRRTLAALAVLLAGLAAVARAGQASPAEPGTGLPGAADSFYGYVRHAFELDGVRCYVVVPREGAKGRPWIWRARFFGHQPQVDIALLELGYHLAYTDVAGLFGSPKAVERFDRFYEYLTSRHGFGKRPFLEGMSRGGLIVLNWASHNPDRVSAVYVDAPVCDIRSWPGGKGKGKVSPADWRACLAAYGLTEEESATAKVSPIDRLEPLAKAKVPILSVCGDADEVVPIEENTRVLQQRYERLGGPIEVIVKRGVGHHPHSLEDPTPIVEFLLRHAR